MTATRNGDRWSFFFFAREEEKYIYKAKRVVVVVVVVVAAAAGQTREIERRMINPEGKKGQCDGE
jgi:hypothetical protein